MNVVIAIDSFKGSMTSMQAGLSAAKGIKRVYKDAHITVRPLADGGEGTVDALVNGCDGRMTQVQVTGPSGHPVVCPYGIVDETHTAIIEMSGAAGITQVSGEEKNPLNTTTYGVGKSSKMRSRTAAGILLSVSVAVPPMTAVSECCRHLALAFWIKTEIRSASEPKDWRIWNPSLRIMCFPNSRNVLSA